MKKIQSSPFWGHSIVFLALLMASLLFLSDVNADTLTYTYDANGRLLKADYGGGRTFTYTYDKAGNILTEVIVEGNPVVLPTLTTTTPVYSITDVTAYCGGNITADGGAMVTARGVCWSISTNPVIGVSCSNDGIGTSTFTSALTNLTSGTPYYVRAYATNTAGTAYGGNVQFTTALSGQYVLAITKYGTGSGTVTVNNGSLSWIGNTGSASYAPNTPVDITASANPGSSFIVWGGGTCSGNSSPCSLNMTGPVDVTSTFNSKADFTGTPVYGQVPLSVAFADMSINSPTAWSWDFGDGGTDSVMNPVHVYKLPGSYNVTLIVSNAGGSSTQTKTGYINVSACFYPKAWIENTTAYSDSVQTIYGQAISSDVILLQAMDFSGGLTIDQAKQVTLKGGRNCDFNIVSGYSTISGVVTISNGEVIVDDIVIK